MTLYVRHSRYSPVGADARLISDLTDWQAAVNEVADTFLACRLDASLCEKLGHTKNYVAKNERDLHGPYIYLIHDREAMVLVNHKRAVLLSEAEFDAKYTEVREAFGTVREMRSVEDDFGLAT